MKSLQLPRLPPRAVALQFLLLCLPGALLVTLIAVGSVRLDVAARMTRLETREAAQVELAAKLVGKDFETVTSDLLALSQDTDLTSYLESGSEADKADLASEFQVFSREKRLYDQIRFIAADGREVVRVNFHRGAPAIVPDAELQDKSGRYYFRDTLRLSRGQIFVSPFDLNVEHERLEVPYKPTIRFGVPVFDRHGNKKGIVVLNYFGAELLRDFKSALERSEGRGMLLNREGYWLSSPDAKDDWGFVFGNGRTFGKDFPAEWRAISSGAHGSLLTANGLFTFATVYPMRAWHSSSDGSASPGAQSAHQAGQDEYQWKIVLHVGNASLPSAGLLSRPLPAALFLGALLVVVVGSGYIAYARVARRQWQRALVDSEARLREIAATLGEGVLVFDPEKRVSFANPEAERLLGRSEQELLGSKGHDLFHRRRADGTPYPEEKCRILAVMQSGVPYRAPEESFWRKDGTLLPVAVSSSPIMREGQVSGAVVAFHDISVRKRAEEALRKANRQLKRLSRSDGLTGIANRRYFDEYLARELRSAAREAQPFAVVMIDVDFFKAYNDRYGHQAGDECLKQIAATLQAHVNRPNDLLARYGGEEFVAVLPDTPLEGALHIAEGLRVAVAELRIAHAESSVSRHVTVSLGVGATDACGEHTAESIVAAADEALYEAKQHGRNRTRTRLV